MLREGNLLVLIFAVVSRFSLRLLIFIVSLSYSFVDIRSRLSLFSCLLFFFTPFRATNSGSDDARYAPCQTMF